MKFLKWHNSDLGLLLVRLGLAVVFIVHGWSKVGDISGTATFFSSLGLNIFWVYVVAYVEFLGGIALLVGIWSRWAGLLIAIDMVFAIYLVKFAGGLKGYEFELTLLLVALAVYFSGSGRYSLRKD